MLFSSCCSRGVVMEQTVDITTWRSAVTQWGPYIKRTLSLSTAHQRAPNISLAWFALRFSSYVIIFIYPFSNFQLIMVVTDIGPFGFRVSPTMYSTSAYTIGAHVVGLVG